MNWPALTAAIIAACTSVILLATLACTVVGAWSICRAVHAWATRPAERQRWRATTRPPRPPHTLTWVSTTRTTHYAPAATPVSTSTDISNQDAEPDLSDPHCGTDDQLLQAVRDIWQQPTREENEQ